MVTPPVLRVGVDLGGLEEEADALEVSLGGGDVQRRAAVVVARVEVDALQVVPGGEGKGASVTTTVSRVILKAFVYRVGQVVVHQG